MPIAVDYSRADPHLRGYGPTSLPIRWPNDARVAVSLVLNIEEGSEFAISKGDALNERIYDMVQEKLEVPDPTMESHFAYGARAGYWQILRSSISTRSPARSTSVPKPSRRPHGLPRTA